MAKNISKSFDILNLRFLSNKSGISYNKIRDNLNGRYESLDANDKTMLANTIRDEVEKAVEHLGFDIRIKRKPLPGKKIVNVL